MTHARWQRLLALLLLAAWIAWLPAAWRSHADAMDYVAECASPTRTTNCGSPA